MASRKLSVVILAAIWLVLPRAAVAASRHPAVACLFYSGLGATAIGITGFSVGYAYGVDADAKYETYLNTDDASSQADLDALRSEVQDLDARSALWYTVGWAGSVVGVGLLTGWILTRGGSGEGRWSFRPEEPRLRIRVLACRDGGQLRLAARF
jgi:hypothetical protein